MARESVISGPSDDDDDFQPSRSSFDLKNSEYDEQLRPQRLVDIVGQRKVVDRLQIMLDAARLRKEPLGHLLLDGPPGLGKTTFATVLPLSLIHI